MSIVRKRRPSHPGRLLKQYYMDPRGITISALAEATHLTRKHISSIVNGRASITAETATRIAVVLGTTPNLWLNLQNAMDLHDAAERLSEEPLEMIPSPIAASVHA